MKREHDSGDDDPPLQEVSACRSRAIAVLYVEPRAATLAAARELLEDIGFEVFTATSGAEARRALRDHDGTVDVLVAELRLPDGDACDLVRELRRTSPGLSVVFMSVYTADEPEVERALEEPGIVYLEKGLGIERLVRMLRTLVLARPCARAAHQSG